jgi:hypothetical protein
MLNVQEIGFQTYNTRYYFRIFIKYLFTTEIINANWPFTGLKKLMHILVLGKYNLKYVLPI